MSLLNLSEESLLDPSTVGFKEREKTGVKMLFVWNGARSSWALFDSRNGECIHAQSGLFWVLGMRLPKVLKVLRRRKRMAIVRDDI